MVVEKDVSSAGRVSRVLMGARASITYSCMKIVPSKSEKHMIFLLMFIKDVSALCIDGLGTLKVFFTSTVGGLVADGAMVNEREETFLVEVKVEL